MTANKSRLKLFLCGILTLIVVQMVAYIAKYAFRPRQVSFKVQNVYSRVADVRNALDTSVMTRDFVVVEGPCKDGCYGGILAQQYPQDIQEVVDGLKGYDERSDTVIWPYQIQPTVITRHNDMWGADSVTITGVPIREQKIFFVAVPEQIVAGPLQWVYVETK